MRPDLNFIKIYLVFGNQYRTIMILLFILNIWHYCYWSFFFFFFSEWVARSSPKGANSMCCMFDVVLAISSALQMAFADFLCIYVYWTTFQCQHLRGFGFRLTNKWMNVIWSMQKRSDSVKLSSIYGNLKLKKPICNILHPDRFWRTYFTQLLNFIC